LSPAGRPSFKSSSAGLSSPRSMASIEARTIAGPAAEVELVELEPVDLE
jgi:hypothetical protein